MGQEVREDIQLLSRIYVFLLKEKFERFLTSHPCLPALPCPNTNLCFALINSSKPKLSDSPLTLNANVWFRLMSCYPSPLGLYFYNILTYGVLVGYERPKMLIISKNLSSALLNPIEINTKLSNDLAFGRVKKVTGNWLFICSPLGLIPKPGGWRHIHHLSHSRNHSVNYYIFEKSAELKYTKLEEVLDMVRKRGQSLFILKRDIKDAFPNIPLAPHISWLFGVS